MLDSNYIYITPDLLKKNGFEEITDTFWMFSGYKYPDIFKDSYQFIISYDFSESYLLITGINHKLGTFKGPLQYVYQLQKAIDLCGIKKDIIII